MEGRRPLLFYFINGLSFCRFIAGPIIAWLLFSELRIIAFILFVFAIFTDFLDGYLARYFKLTSEFGRNCDGIADFSLTIFSLGPLVIFGDLPDFFVIIMIVAGTLVFLKTFFNTVKKGQISIPQRRISAVINAYFLYLAIGCSILNFVHKPLAIFLSSILIVLTIFDYFIYNPEK